MSTNKIRVERWELPESVDSADAGLYLAYVAAINETDRVDSGTELFHTDAAESLVWLRDEKYRGRRAFVALEGDEPLGFAALSWALDTTNGVEFSIVVLPQNRGRGVEDALLRTVEEAAAQLGRRTMNCYTLAPAHALAAEPLTPCASGHGGMPTNDWGTQLLLRHGYELGLIERVSTFGLERSWEPVRDMLEGALATAGPEYRAVWWQIPTPPEYADGYAAAIGRLDVDSPSGTVPVEEQRWDAQRVFDQDAIKLAAGQLMAVTAVIHEPTGQVAAYNELFIGADRGKPSENWGTLVMPEHRGRRLGTVVKCAGLLRWRELVPTSSVVFTFNAVENRYMLNVNESVGYEPAAFCGEWTKTLPLSAPLIG